MNFQAFVGKTVSAINLDDQNVQLTFMFTDGTAYCLVAEVTEIQNTEYPFVGPGGVRKVQGVTAFLHHEITSIQEPSLTDPIGTPDGYFGLEYRALQLNTTNGNLVIGYVANIGAPTGQLIEAPPADDNLLTQDFTYPTEQEPHE